MINQFRHSINISGPVINSEYRAALTEFHHQVVKVAKSAITSEENGPEYRAKELGENKEIESALEAI